LSVLFLLFNITFVSDRLEGRFVFFVPLLLIPLIQQKSSNTSATFLAPALLVLALLTVGIRTVAWTRHRMIETFEQQGGPTGFVPLFARLSKELQPETASVSNGVLLIGRCDWWKRASG
jgi:hypothetical protein